MKFVRHAAAGAALVAALAGSQGAWALDIVLTNDDGFESALTYAVYQRLNAAGHRVIISASTADQSGRGGSVDFLRPVLPLTAPSRGGCALSGAPGVGNLALGGAFVSGSCPVDPNVFWVAGTPVASSLYGIDVAAMARWGKQADLVVSGPNFGNNTGLVNNSSGTVNAALIAVNRGIPAIAVSAADPTTYRSFQSPLASTDFELADIVVRVVETLEHSAARRSNRGNALLPQGVGLNVNVPKFQPGSGASLPFRLSEVGVATSAMPYFSADLCADPVAKQLLGPTCAGANPPKLAGVSVAVNGAPLPVGLTSIIDADPRSEQNVVNAGAIAISVIEGNHEAPRQAEKSVAKGLRALVGDRERDDD